MEYPWNIVAYAVMALVLLSAAKDIFVLFKNKKAKNDRLTAEGEQMTRESEELLTRIFSPEFNEAVPGGKPTSRALLHKNVITFKPLPASQEIATSFNSYTMALILSEKAKKEAPAKDLFEDGLNEEERLAATLIICAYAGAGEALGRNRQDKPMALAALLAICFVSFELAIRPLDYSQIDPKKLENATKDAFNLFLAMIIEKPIQEGLGDEYANLRADLEKCQYHYKQA